MQPEIRHALNCLLRGEALSADAVERAFGTMMDGRSQEVEIAALLTALAMKGESEEELAGAAAAMRARATTIPTSRTGLIDTCGTGGDGFQTFNISTATALVVAGTGVPVAKHGNRSVSSSSGSADVLEALGVNIGLTAEQAGKCLDDVGICFCYARTCHTAMRHVAPIRQQLGFRTIFNLLGPLTNPAGAEFQLLGASNDRNAAKLAGALKRFDLRRGLVVCGNDQLDEVSLWGDTTVWEIRNSEVTVWSCRADDFEMPVCHPDDLRVDSAAESADVIQRVLSGEAGHARNIVLANAAMALLCVSDASDLDDSLERAQASVDSGQAAAVLQRLVEWTQSAGKSA